MLGFCIEPVLRTLSIFLFPDHMTCDPVTRLGLNQRRLQCGAFRKSVGASCVEPAPLWRGGGAWYFSPYLEGGPPLGWVRGAGRRRPSLCVRGLSVGCSF